jgi:hypothetical protein
MVPSAPSDIPIATPCLKADAYDLFYSPALDIVIIGPLARSLLVNENVVPVLLKREIAHS